MSKDHIMAIDQGTTSCRTIIYDLSGIIVSSSQKKFRQIFPHAGWVEHDPLEIWETQLFTIQESLEKAGLEANDLLTIGITNQRETTVIWDKKSGIPLYNAIVWQDNRTAAWCRKLIEEGWQEKIKSKTGLVIDSYFSASKVAWILENIVQKSEVNLDDVCFGTIDTWLLWKLSAGKVHSTDVSNASRTMMFNIHDLKWDHELLDKFEIPFNILPSVQDSSYNFGEAVSDVFSKANVPITGILGDQQAALFGQDCLQKGMAKNTYGTGCFILLNTGSECVKSTHGLLTTIGWKTENELVYALEGSVFNAGSAINWFVDNLNIIDDIGKSSQIAEEIQDTEGVYVIPAFSGLGSPYWDMDARAAIVGLTRRHSKKHILRAILESIAFRSADVLFAMEKDANTKLHELRVDGGVCKNDFLMQYQADLLGVEVLRPESIESTAFGAAKIALRHFDSEYNETGGNTMVFKPKMNIEKRNMLYNKWKLAVGRVLTT